MAAYSVIALFRSVVTALVALYCASSAANTSAPLSIKLCNVATIEIHYPPVDAIITVPISATSVAVAVAAVNHINARNFTLIRDGAALLGNRDVSVELLSVNLRSTTDAYLAPISMAVKTCSELGAHFILGLQSAAFAEAGSLMTQYYGTPLSSVMVVSPRLSDEETFPLFHRLAQTTVDRIRPVVRFIQKMGWRQVAIAYSADVGGEATRNALQEELAMVGVTVAAFAFPAAEDVQSYVTQVAAIVSSGIKVALNYLRIDDLGILFEAIHGPMAEEGASDISWIQPSPPMDVLTTLAYPDYSWIFPYIEKGMDGMLAFHREYDYSELQNAYMGVDLEPIFNKTVEADGSPVDILPATYRFAHRAIESESLVRMYDSVWAAVGALVSAEETLTRETNKTISAERIGTTADKARRALALQAHSEITSGNVSFTGLSGPIRFRPNGDFNVEPDTELVLVNYVLTSPDDTTKSTDDGALLRMRCSGRFMNGEWDLHVGESDGALWPIHWPGGGVYPHVPTDGSSPLELAEQRAPGTSVAVILVSGAATIVLLGLLAAVLAHNRRLRERVHYMQEAAANMDLDMDAPAAKIVKFLRAYQHAGTRFRPRKPSTSEAAALEALLIQQMGHLSAPDIKKQLDSRSRRSNEVFYNHVILEYTSGRSVLDGDAVLSGPSPGVSMYGQRFPRDIESSVDDDCAANWPICPRDVMRQAGSDFFLDAVTGKSPLQKSSAPLAAMVKGAVDALQLLPSSPQELIQLIQFTRMVEQGYPRAGYHCLLHAADVTNHLASLLRMAGIGTALHSSAHRRTMLAAVFGAAIHDYKHPQVNNAFLVEEGDELAMEFNDHSVLEMYSLRSAFELLAAHPELDFTAKWGAPARRVFRRTVIDIVLATDMGQHFSLLGQFTTQIGQNNDLIGKSGAEKWEAMDSGARALTLKVAIKVADLGHCFTRLEQHLEWGQRLQEEFFMQGDREKAAGREPSPLMDRNSIGPADPGNTAGFLRVIALPLISAWVEVFPECEPMLQQAKNNLASSQQRAAILAARHCDNPDCRQPPNAEEASTAIQREGSHE